MEGGVKTVVVAFFTNGILAVAKFVAFFFTGSSSLLAEAFHSTAVTTNQGLLYYGHKSSRRRATRTHQFGYGRERYFWSFVVSFLVFSVGALVALYEAYHKWTHPEPISSPLIAYGVLTPALLLATIAFLLAREMRSLLIGESATAIDEIERDIRDCVGKARIIAIEPTVTVGR
ncbi:cation diffusion facilitator family transporter [Pseudonocardia nigra]|uniref:cation diffusion facilitator family transporter n=1 Tax=Pseudonocardia nigra TaxID=1921578 RepID=UPI001C5EB5C9|nr:cation transporter [Pseudonocardia nigra]